MENQEIQANYFSILIKITYFTLVFTEDKQKLD